MAAACIARAGTRCLASRAALNSQLTSCTTRIHYNYASFATRPLRCAPVHVAGVCRRQTGSRAIEAYQHVKSLQKRQAAAE